MAKTHFTITADDKDFEGAVRRLQRDFLKLEEINKRLVDQSKRANSEAKDQAKLASEGARLWGGQLQSVVAGYASIQGVMKLVTAELERQKQLQKGAADAHRSVAQAEREFILNAGYATRAEARRGLSQIQGIALRANVSYEETLRGASIGTSFEPDANKALRAMEQAARLNPFDLPETTKALLTVGKVTGSDDAAANLGLLLAVQKYTPITSTSSVGQFGGRSAAAIRTAGDSDIQAFSLFNAFASALNDPTGETAGTHAQKFAARLQAFVPQLPDTQARREYLLANPEKAKQFASRIEQSISKAYEVQLITDPNARISQDYNQSLRALPAASTRRAYGESRIAVAQDTPTQRVSDLERAVASTSEAMAIANPRAAEAGVLRDQLQKVVEQSDVGLISGYAATYGFELGLLRGVAPREAFNQSAALLQSRDRQSGNMSGWQLIGELIKEVRLMRENQLGRDDAARALRQNAQNDLNTHVEGR